MHLTPTQQGMLFHHWRAGRHSGVDIEQIVIRLDEAIDPARMREAWQATVQHHSALRTRFEGTGLDEPRQHVDATVALPWAQEDWRDTPAPELTTRLSAWLAHTRTQGFDLSKSPLTQVALLRTGEAAWQMVWTVHHIVCDGRSFPIVVAEVFSRYDLACEGRKIDVVEPADTPEAADFSNHVQYVAAQIETQAKTTEAFWRQRLKGLAVAPLPGDGVTDAAGRTGRGHQQRSLDSSLAEALGKVAARHSLSINTLLQGAWAMLLARFTGEDDVIFGATRSGRREQEAGVVGCLINTLPVRITVDGEACIAEWLAELRAFGFSALMQVQRWSDAKLREDGGGLFDSVIVYDHQSLDGQMHSTSQALAAPARWSSRRFDLVEQTNYPVTLYAWGGSTLSLRLAWDQPRVPDAMAQRLLGGLVRLLEGIAADPLNRIETLSILSPEDEASIRAWNATTTAEGSYGRGIHGLIEAQATSTPQAVAVVHHEQSISYEALNRRANRLAFHLLGLGVGPDVPVALLLSRSIDLMVGMLAVLKAGGCYVPLDPAYPRERLAYTLGDSGAKVLLTQTTHMGLLDPGHATVVQIDHDAGFERHPDFNPATAGDAGRLAYLIYTSGSTGKPKGVMIEHRNVLNFFVGMDERVPGAKFDPGTAHAPSRSWLAVTSLSFDISVLELLWTLARGYKVVLHDEPLAPAVGTRARAHDERPIAFSLMYFASARTAGEQKYRLLLEGAKFADAHGFQAVWTPERHFHDFGGLYPNPSIASAALAAVTSRIALRAGSVVAALHHPARIAEEWAVADNLSGGRIGISFAAGWQPRDFVLAPQAYETARASMLDAIDQVRRLWRGEALTMPGPQGQSHAIQTLPRPVQAELPVWLTAAGSPETFREAGSIGAGVLTHLLGQSIDEVAQKLAVYREAWRAAGHPGQGHVTLMLHTFIGDNTDAVREAVRQPMVDYLASSLGLVKGFLQAWTAFKRSADGQLNTDVDLDSLSDEERRGLLEYAFERYFETSGLFGDESAALDRVDQLKSIGVDEIACLIDFGVDEDTTLAHLQHLARVQRAAQPMVDESIDIGTQIQRHGVTHLQCTPSLASALMLDPGFVAQVPKLQVMMLGGEALPPALAAELRDAGLPTLLNMYGPTETTIWSTTHKLLEADGVSIPLGAPIANTTLHVVDRHGQELPPGVAGELWIGGAGVARGYHGRPELTAERFVRAPWSFHRATHHDEGRFYRTGDLVRRRDDGLLDFLGRIDHQVKIRGHRIELGEIEAALAALPSVRECVVIAREDAPGEQRLVAYVVATDGATLIDTQALRASLRESLPEVMVPGHIVVMPSLPQTPNRKLDRKALPAPESLARPTHDGGATLSFSQSVASGRQLAQALREAVASPLEREITEVWQRILGTRKIGLDDNFFDLGGHSLLAVKAHRMMLMEVPQAAIANLSITDLFRFPTVRALARRLDSHTPTAPAAQAGSDRAALRRDALAARRGPRPAGPRAS
jgi:natural product biosynthesis luciferase-like monooxygenase protein